MITPSDHMSTSYASLLPSFCAAHRSVELPLQDLRSHVPRAAAVRRQPAGLRARRVLREPEIGYASRRRSAPTDLDRARATVHQNVLRLEVAVRDVLLVAVPHRLHQRLHHRARLVLVVELLLHDLIEQLAA